jgi:hypothetical protein
LSPLRIEVKTSNSTPDVSMLHISRNEWAFARVSDNYVFHPWSLLPPPKLVEVSFQQIAKHIPTNQGSGDWESVEITYIACTSNKDPS